MLIARYSIDHLPKSSNMNRRRGKTDKGRKVLGFLERQAQRKARDVMREAINQQPRPSLYPLPGPFRLDAIFYMPTYHHRDIRQLCTQLKPYEDELIAAGIIAGDSWRFIPYQTAQAIYRKNMPGFDIEIWELEE